MQEENIFDDESDGVSPVIATILMVAITVVLSGVLYVWASELAGNQTDFGTLNRYSTEDSPGSVTGSISDSLVRMSFSSGGDDLSWAFTEIKLMNDDRVIPCKVGTMPESNEEVPDRDITADVDFTFIDQNLGDVLGDDYDGYHNDFSEVLISGSFNGFNKISMTSDSSGKIWTYSVTLEPGQYSWNIEADGDDFTPSEGLNVVISDDGVISGDITYSISPPEPEPLLWYADTDGDGFGDSESTTLFWKQPVGYVADNTDCDDSNPAITPDDLDGDGIIGCLDCNDNDVTLGSQGNDHDCDGILNPDDEDSDDYEYTWYQDSDGDTFGNSAVSISSSTQPVGYVLDNTDCNDGNADVHPGATEIPGDGLDNDCLNGDEPLPESVFRVIDQGNNFANLKIKGEFNNWVPEPMTLVTNINNVQTWEFTLNTLNEGTYEWGAIEDDGSQYGIWLPELAGFTGNPSIQVDSEGNGLSVIDIAISSGTPTTFIVDDTSSQYFDIELKGDFSNWANWQMYESEPNIWTKTVLLSDGTYEWGAVENDGSEFGVWLPSIVGFSNNPSVTIVDDTKTGDVALEMPSVNVFPVTFTIVDGGNNYGDIEIKGQLPPSNDWNQRNMNQNGNTWTYSISLEPGTFEWGAVENDGSQYGIWLPSLAGFSSNPSVTVANDGTISGDLTFTVPNQNSADYYTMNEDNTNTEFQYAADCIIIQGGTDDTSWEATEVINLYEGGTQICISWDQCEVEVSVFYRGKLIAGDSGSIQLF